MTPASDSSAAQSEPQIPPPLLEAVLSLMVLLVRVSLPLLSMPPPRELAVLRVTVTLVSVAAPLPVGSLIE